MMVMTSNYSGGRMHYLAGKFPGLIGHLYSPASWRNPVKWLPYALDNGAYTGFDPVVFEALLGKAKLAAIKPLWAAVPDVVADRDATLASWSEWEPKMPRIPLAFVVQDGMSPKDVPASAAVVFVGGTPVWKMRSLEVWVKNFKRVHVGRVNTERLLWVCHDYGVESVDGTGWFHDNQLDQLERYCETVATIRKRQVQLCL